MCRRRSNVHAQGWVTPRNTSQLAFWSVACQKATNARKAAYRKWCRSRTMASFLDYKLENARCRRFLREQRRRSFEQLCQGLNEKCNMRLAWSFVHGVAGMGQVTGINSSQLLADLGVDEALKAAHTHFSALYTSKSNREAQDCEILPTRGVECGAFTAPFSLDALNKSLARRKSTSPGEDGITYALLKSLPKAAKKRLLDLYNESWRRGFVPRHWKEGLIILLPKLGRALELLKNWRPICLISCLIKLLESMVNDRLLWLLAREGLLATEQNGLRWKRSTHDCLHGLSSTIRYELERQNSVGILHMDISAAYDSVDTGLLFEELCSLGLPRVTCQWFQSYLSDRHVRIRVGDEYTESVALHRGLMQGSVLSPTLWNIYGARLIRQTKEQLPLAKLVNFADDFQFYAVRFCPYETAKAIEQTGEVFIEVCQNNYLAVSQPKCIPMLHTQRTKKPACISLQGTP